MWLHQGGHGGTSTNDWQRTQNKWFDYWLYGIENGIMNEPMVDVQRENKTWEKLKKLARSISCTVKNSDVFK